MKELIRLTSTELKLLLRDATALFVVLALPVGFLLIFGNMASGGPGEARQRHLAPTPAPAASSSPPWPCPSP